MMMLRKRKVILLIVKIIDVEMYVLPESSSVVPTNSLFRLFLTFQIHTLILLSLGSLLPLSSYFPFSSTSQQKPLHIHIVDSHRPYNLQNLFGWGVNDGWVPGGDDYTMTRGAAGAATFGDDQGRGRIWVWGDGSEGKLEAVKKSWEAIEVSKSPLNVMWKQGFVES
jgi:hypothetical protein